MVAEGDEDEDVVVLMLAMQMDTLIIFGTPSTKAFLTHLK